MLTKMRVHCPLCYKVQMLDWYQQIPDCECGNKFESILVPRILGPVNPPVLGKDETPKEVKPYYYQSEVMARFNRPSIMLEYDSKPSDPLYPNPTIRKPSHLPKIETIHYKKTTYLFAEIEQARRRVVMTVCNHPNMKGGKCLECGYGIF